MKRGDRVQFNCAFECGDVRVEIDDVGTIYSAYRGFGASHFTVATANRLWMCKPHEIRPLGTEIAQADRRIMKADQQLIDDFLAWSAAREGNDDRA